MYGSGSGKAPAQQSRARREGRPGLLRAVDVGGREKSIIAGRYPDFTLVADDFGVRLEGQSEYAGQIARAGDRAVELHR